MAGWAGRSWRESFGALHAMLAGVPEHERQEAWIEIESELSRFERPDGFECPCELLVAAGTKQVGTPGR